MKYWQILILILAAQVPINVHANCPTGPPIVMGTIPADGQVDVRLDTTITVFTQSVASASLNGVELQGTRINTWNVPENLEPNTEYEVVFSLADDAPERPELRVNFTTGSETVGTVSPPEVNGYRIIHSTEIPDAACREFVAKTGCSDQGEPTFVHFDTEDDRDLLIVNTIRSGASQLWPSSCGQPAWQGYGDPCFNVYAFENGLLSEPTQVCGQPLVPKGSLESDGCSQASGKTSLPVLLMLIGFGWLFRRRT